MRNIGQICTALPEFRNQAPSGARILGVYVVADLLHIAYGDRCKCNLHQLRLPPPYLLQIVSVGMTLLALLLLAMLVF